MCRLFGFRSVIQSQVHRSLLAADNALGQQSRQHPDGWGVAYYIDGAPHVTRSTATAGSDQIFHRLSGVVASETVLAHVRRATVGPISVLNCHPFQHGRWIMAHNGEVRDFPKFRDALIAEAAPRLRRFILGDTDSEVVFYLFLTQLSKYGALSNRFGIEEVMEALGATVALVRSRCNGDADLLTLIVTDGNTMAGIHGGKELFWSSYKRQCADRGSCPHLAPECEAPTTTGSVNHMILSSEPLSGENVWIPMKPGDMIGVDWRMRLTTHEGSPRHLAVVR